MTIIRGHVSHSQRRAYFDRGSPSSRHAASAGASDRSFSINGSLEFPVRIATATRTVPHSREPTPRRKGIQALASRRSHSHHETTDRSRNSPYQMRISRLDSRPYLRDPLAPALSGQVQRPPHCSCSRHRKAKLAATSRMPWKRAFRQPSSRCSGGSPNVTPCPSASGGQLRSPPTAPTETCDSTRKNASSMA